MLCGSGFDGRFFEAQPSHIDIKFPNVSLSNGLTIHPFLIGPPNDLIVDIRKVSDEGYLISTISKIAIDHIENDRRAGMANMAKVVNGHPTDIHPHFFLLKGKEILFIASQSVVDADWHKSHPKQEQWNGGMMETEYF